MTLPSNQGFLYSPNQKSNKFKTCQNVFINRHFDVNSFQSYLSHRLIYHHMAMTGDKIYDKTHHTCVTKLKTEISRGKGIY